MLGKHGYMREEHRYRLNEHCYMAEEWQLIFKYQSTSTGAPVCLYTCLSLFRALFSS